MNREELWNHHPPAEHQLCKIFYEMGIKDGRKLERESQKKKKTKPKQR